MPVPVFAPICTVAEMPEHHTVHFLRKVPLRSKISQKKVIGTQYAKSNRQVTMICHLKEQCNRVTDAIRYPVAIACKVLEYK